MRYRIDQSDENRDWENFEINENTGEITTTVRFDREEVKTYLINVIAENVIPLALGTQEPNRGMLFPWLLEHRFQTEVWMLVIVRI